MHINVFEAHAADGDYWIDVLAVGRFQSETASLLGLAYCNGVWFFELLYTKPLWLRLRDWLDDRGY